MKRELACLYAQTAQTCLRGERYPKHAAGMPDVAALERQDDQAGDSASGAETPAPGSMAVVDRSQSRLRTAAAIASLLVAYCVIVASRICRPLWYDEILTFYGASAHSLAQFVGAVTHFDFNPPLSYVFARLSLWAFGSSPAALRLPFVLAFLGAALLIFCYLRRRVGDACALYAAGTFLGCWFTSYATEARPYAFVLLFLAMATTGWLNLQNDRNHWTASHTGVLLGSIGLVLSHCLGPLNLLPIALGEITDGMRRRRLDWRLWLALLSPVPLIIVYLPILHGARLLYPLSLIPTIHEAPIFSLRLAAGFFIPLLCLLIVPLHHRTAMLARPGPSELPNAGYFAGAAILPLLIYGYMGHAHAAFWMRYCIGSVVPVSIGVAMLLRRLSSIRAGASVTAVAALLLLSIAIRLPGFWRQEPTYSFKSVEPELPLVAASSITFLEMDFREPPETVRRLVYLTDHQAATTWHFTEAEDFGDLHRYYPIRATVRQFSAFAQHHRHFVVFGTPGWREEWLFQKLADVHATVTPLAVVRAGYFDRQLFDVRLK